MRIKLSHCPGITLPGIQPKENKWAYDRDNGIPMFIAASFRKSKI
jgi:hypothetical protein